MFLKSTQLKGPTSGHGNNYEYIVGTMNGKQ